MKRELEMAYSLQGATLKEQNESLRNELKADNE